jgi:hypothetical protein
MKNFIEWAREKGLWDEYALTSQGKKNFDTIKALRTREKKGTGKKECPICDSDPCTCKTTSTRNRLKTK